MIICMIEITIPGKPLPFKSPRVFEGRAFNPRYREKEQIQWIIRSQYNGKVIQEAVSVFYEFYFIPPKSWSKKKRLAALEGRLRHTTKPDASNIIKLYEDSLKGIVIEDDSQVVYLMAEKSYSEKEKVVIKITILPIIEESEEIMDKKMRSEVGKPLKAAEKLVKKAEKNNSRLANYDQKIRDPIIDKATKGKKLPKPPKSVK